MIAIDMECCTGCGVCLQVCPREVLSLEARRADAIVVTKGTGCLLAILREDIMKTARPGTGCGCGASGGGLPGGGCG